MNVNMGKFSKPRKDSSVNPEYELDFDLDLDQEPTPEPEAAFDRFDDVSDIPMDELTPPQAAPVSPKPVKKGNKTRKILLITLCAVTLLLIGVIACIWFTSGIGINNGLILDNVMVAGVNIGGMSQEEAAAAIQESVAPSFAQDMVIQLPDTTLTLSAADSAVQLDVEAIIDDAYQYGRSGSWSENKQTLENAANTSYEVDLTGLVTLNTEFIRNELDTYCSTYNSDFVQSSVTVEGEMPVLDTADEKFDPEAPCQTIVVNMGTPGRFIDPEKLYNQVIEAYNQRVFELTVTPDAEEVLPDELTQALTELHETQTLEAVDSTLDLETSEPTAEVYGYSFDLEAALVLIGEAVHGDTIELQFEYILPTITKESMAEMLFRDVLASYETKHTNNSNRNTNLKLACASINGMILMPGEQFDYNTALGKRTAEAGYKAADAYSGGKTVQTIGGGICQVSSTLYYCTLLADLQIDVRQEHSYTSSYMPLGMDATVSWGGPHFRFTNNTNYPIRIEAEVSGGYVKIKLIGTDEKDYYVKMEYEVLSNTYATTVTEEHTKESAKAKGYKDGQVIQTAYNGCNVQSYKCKYDKETDELISREKEALSKYKKRDKIVIKIVATEETTAPTKPTETTKPTESTKPAETTPPTEAPTQTTPPETKPAETAAPEAASQEAPAAETEAPENMEA